MGMNYYTNIDYGRPLDNIIVGTQNFKYKEVVSSPSAMKLGIKNIPNEIIWRNAEVAAQKVLQPIRDKFGPITINSWYRAPELNSSKLIGGSRTSHHCFGYAIDLQPAANVSMVDVMRWITENLQWTELIAEYFPAGWIHIAYKEDRLTSVIKLKDKDHNYAQVDMDYIDSLYS